MQVPTNIRGRIPALAGILLLLLTAFAATQPLRPSEPRPVSAPTGDFSAARAVAQLDRIAKVPHPAGSAAQADVREYLVGELRKLGLRPEVQTRVAPSDADSPAVVGSVSNIHATIPGEKPTGRVLLVAHYDSVPIAPGAGDDGSNVAAILEIARVLKTGAQPRNDIEILFTDGEEQGLLGAQAFVDAEAGSRPTADPRRTVVVNMEGRGTSGPVMMFQKAGTGLTSAVKASGALTTSFSAAIYEKLPNDTDLTVFDEAGMRGLNFAFMNGSAHYHTAHDSISRLDTASVQDMGDAALGAVRRLGGTDLSQSGPDATYFSLFGTVVSYPAWLALPLALTALLGVPLLLWLGRSRGLSPRGAGRAALTFPLTLTGAAAIGLAGWPALSLARPDFALSEGSVHHLGRYAWGGALLLLVLLVAWYRWARRKASPLDIVAGVLGWFAMLAVVCAVLLPGAAYLFTWPALIGLAVLAVTLRFTRSDSPWRVVAGVVTALPVAALVLPVVLLLLPALGLSLIAAPLVLAALLAAALLSLLEPLPSHRAFTVGMLATAVAGAGTLVMGTALDGYSADEPRPVSLGYVLESDTGKATWVSDGDTSQPTVGKLLTGEPARFEDRIPALDDAVLANGPAKAAPLDAPLTKNASAVETEGVRTIRVRVQGPADAHTIAVHADTHAHQILDATVEGAKLTGGPKRPQSDWGWSFSYAAPPTDGIDVVIRTRGKGPLPIRVVSTTAGLPDEVGAPTLATDQSWASWPSVAGQTFVVRTFRI
ncbi:MULTISPECIES: M20/M25/M40 family metallo-hydrolase [unclassified Streptomyces]|uniref:M20/M25/M40 family metallo-hydrolase n=1 Tax=unclassified Streptomyces TaxID=2593676 RepID=UPI00225C2A7B|nr:MULTISPECIES: M20/M25/M40 family metallo-hydrolase [unclassified Streptomyces]WSX06043.1 M20/M25/M40 family metallo-hydrolase [Streptomyces sp. NBC_00987]MCX5103771.1 M20/M25/M40 family metallo-hydrolase [Streptomyces sp. NBC_00439]MCX5103849.1 M20/M25/M40 family metallo-hydrolase [Streptomyces sp. NBC_00439]WSC32010.1 M20/M25/M40 family metallo-hydrolase [Streptomyces sp. NBC_01768]WSC32074.1 M20/M25/M40 family metallo-hydrolase [Streptomyces sp. NBC_01768]